MGFRTSFGGYNKKEVDAYILEMEQRYINLANQLAEILNRQIKHSADVVEVDNIEKKSQSHIQDGVSGNSSDLLSDSPPLQAEDLLGGAGSSSFAELLGDKTLCDAPKVLQRDDHLSHLSDFFPNLSQQKSEDSRMSASDCTIRSKVKNRIGDILFFTALLLVVFVVFLFCSSDGNPKIIAGYSSFTVLTGSMQDEIPQGSLVITKQVDPSSLKIGDDITYFVSPNVTVTHRIIGIKEDYLGTGERAFDTKGIMNSLPDSEPIPAANIVGKVVYHNLMLGKIAEFTKQNWPIFVFFGLVLFILYKVLIWIFRDPNQHTTHH